MEYLGWNDDPFEIMGPSNTLKSEAELRMWETPEEASEGEKATIILGSGFPNQIRWIMTNLPLLIKDPKGTGIIKDILVPFT